LVPDRKVVLVATQTWPIPKGKAFLRNILRALKNLPELQTVIKPHPREKREWHKEVVEEENAKAVVLSKNSETFEALYACDLLVTEFSTTITEAVILGKPVVALTLSKIRDDTPYYQKVTLRVYSGKNLVPAIKKALFDEKTREMLKKLGKKIASEHEYKHDGKATERVTSLIERMTKSKNCIIK